MRLSKTKKEEIKENQALSSCLSETEKKNRSDEILARIRSARTAEIEIIKERKPNRKKDKSSRRKRSNLGVFIPFALRKPQFLKHPLTGKRTIFNGYRGFQGISGKQETVNDDILRRAEFAVKKARYQKITNR